MVILPQTKLPSWHSHIQIWNGAIAGVPILSLLTDSILLRRDPLIEEHGLVTNCQTCFYGFLPGAHFLDEQEEVQYFLLAKVSLGGNERSCKSKYRTWLYWRSTLHRRKVPWSIHDFCCSYRPVVRRNLKFLRPKKAAQGALDDLIN